jgi:hypothetical protein
MCSSASSAYSACSAVSSSGTGPTEKLGACSAVAVRDQSQFQARILWSRALSAWAAASARAEIEATSSTVVTNDRPSLSSWSVQVRANPSAAEGPRAASSANWSATRAPIVVSCSGSVVGGKRAPHRRLPQHYRGGAGDSAPFSGTTGPNSRELAPQNTISSRLKKTRNPARMLGLCSTSCPRNSPPPFKN